MVRRVFSVLFIVLLILGVSASVSRVHAAPQGQGSLRSPLQNALAETFTQRQAAGLPIPDMTTSQQVTGTPPVNGLSALSAPSTVTTTIRLNYSGPEEAGYTTWPRWIVDESLDPSGNGTVAVGDYTDLFRTAVAQAIPGFWDEYEFGYEPRTFIFTETISFHPPDIMPQVVSGARETTEDILMGFTYIGLQYDYTLEAQECVFHDPDLFCASFRVGFALNWAVGLRLPATVTLSGPATVEAGDTYRPSAVLTPLDWEAADFADAGVAEEDGNEYILRFTLFGGLSAQLAGVELCNGCAIDFEIENSDSFTTPFGPGSAFPLGAAEIPRELINVLDVITISVGLGLEPQVGSSQITADWEALGNATGNGTVTFTAPGTPVELGTVTVPNPGPGNPAQVQLSNFEYWFNQFLLRIYLFLDFTFFDLEPVHPEVTLYTFDLSALTSMTGLDDLAVSNHSQCDWLFNCNAAGPDNVLVLSSDTLAPPAPPNPGGGGNTDPGGGGTGITAASVAVGPPAPLCADLNGTTTETIRAQVPSDTVTKGSVFCRSLVEDRVFVQNSAEIGKPEILDRGVIQAVDVFALFHDGRPTAFFNHSPMVCLRGSGALLYLDATVAPRTVSELPVFMQSGYTCGLIPNAGTVVLVGGSPDIVQSAPATTTPISNCMVTTQAIVNLRAEPNATSTVVKMVPYNVTLTAFERSAGWYHVDYLGSRGWVSAGFVSPQGTCQ